MSIVPVCIGIDVACAKGKRLPVCFASWLDGRLEPLEVPDRLERRIPRGIGNVAGRATKPFAETAGGVADAIATIRADMKWSIERVAIDAPAKPARAGGRLCEAQLVEADLSVFKTPDSTEWALVIDKCVAHLDGGGPLARLPYANKVWMLYGFELFSAFRRAELDVIEVYPFAIAHALLGSHPHKSTPTGYGLQLDAIARRTGWSPSALEARLRETVGGNRHDRLDAFMASWIASSPRKALKAYGDPSDHDDTIWVPRL